MQINDSKTESKRTVVALGIASLFNDISSEMLIPLIPLYIIALGGSPLNVGLIAGLRDSIANLLPLFIGFWSDHIGRRKLFITSGYLVSTICKFFLAFAATATTATIWSSLERTGKGIRTASRDALIAASAKQHEGFGFGLHQALDTTGAIIGTLIAIILSWFFMIKIPEIIFFAALINLLAFIPLLWIPKTKRPKTAASLRSLIKVMPYRLKIYLVLSGLFACSNFSYMFFLLRARNSFPGRTGIAIALSLYLIFNVIYAVFSVPMGQLSDRIGRKKIIAWGFLLFSLTTLGFTFAQTFFAFVPLFISYGLVNAILNSNQRAVVADLAIDYELGTSLGIFHTVMGLGALFANLVAGALYSYTPQTTFLYGAVISGIAGLVLVLL